MLICNEFIFRSTKPQTLFMKQRSSLNAPKGIPLMVKSMCTQYLVCSKWIRSCIVLPSQGNHRETLLLNAQLLLHSHHWIYLAHWDIPGPSLWDLWTHRTQVTAWKSSSMCNLDMWSWSHIYQCWTKSRIYSPRWVWSYNSILCADKKIYFFYTYQLSFHCSYSVKTPLNTMLSVCSPCSDTRKYKPDSSSLTETGKAVRDGP